MTPSNPEVPVVRVDERTSWSTSLILTIIGLVGAIAASWGTTKADVTHGREELVRVEQTCTAEVAAANAKIAALETQLNTVQQSTTREIGDLRGDVRVLNSNMELLLRRLGVIPLQTRGGR
jgi:hypothetical protein